MNERQRTGAVFGVILILVGLLFLAGQLLPGLFGWTLLLSWPLIVVGVGILLLVLGVLVGAPGLVVPACIVGGIGLLLYWQNLTGNWESWAYAWTLIPGFAGVGTLLLGLLTRNSRAMAGGIWSVIISLVLFAIFASFLGGLNFLGAYWPVLLIALGVLLLGRSFFGFARRRRWSDEGAIAPASQPATDFSRWQRAGGHDQPKE